MAECCFSIRAKIAHLAPTSVLTCTQHQLQAQKQCVAQRQQKILNCDKQAQQSYSACSKWGPFKGLCIAWKWLTRLVCVAWSWLTSLVCIAWHWFMAKVCIAWKWVTYLVEVGFFWMLYTLCTAVLWPCMLGWRLKCRNQKDAPRNDLEKPGWILTFEDDFTTTALDATKWQDVPWYGARYLHDWTTGTTPSVYLDPVGFSPAPGTLRLVSTNQPVPAQTDANWKHPVTQQLVPFTIPYRGAWMMWPNPGVLDQQYGYFEIRCRTPVPPEAFPAFWLYGRHKEPEEIDIFEFNVSGLPEAFTTTVHWGPDKAGRHTQGKTHQVCRPWEIFHTYACEWSPTAITWYLDNQLIRVVSKDNIVSEFTYPLALIVNTGPLAGAGYHPEKGVYPNYFEVDYVRAYRRP